MGRSGQCLHSEIGQFALPRRFTLSIQLITMSGYGQQASALTWLASGPAREQLRSRQVVHDARVGMPTGRIPHGEFVTDGTAVWETNDTARTWYPVEPSGLKEPYRLSNVVDAHGKVFAVASALGNAEHNATRIYSGPVGEPVLRPLSGFEVVGGLTYGDVAADGDVRQV